MRLRSLIGAAVLALALAWPVAATAASEAPTLTLRAVAGSGGERTYEADLRVAGVPVSGADLDIGGLGDDPDLRVATQKMPASGSAYRATLTFPSGGDWVLVVRAHAPVQIVELFTVKVDGIPVADHAAAAASPSRRAMLRLDPKTSTEAAASTHGASGSVVNTALPRTFDVEASLIRALHSLGAVAWLFSVLGLVLANRLGPGWGRDQLTSFIAQRYTMLAGLGLGVVVFTGLINMQRSSAGLFTPTELLRSGLGTAYLCVFAVKMVAVAVSLFTSAKIGRVLSGRGIGSRSSAAFAPTSFAVTAFPATAVPGTATPSQGPPTMTASSQARLFRLAETNVAIGAFILVAVAILGQLHPLLH